MIVGVTPVRISFAGGGTDLPEYYEKFGGEVISTSISRFTYVIVHPRFDKSFQAFSPDFQKHYKPTHFENIEISDGTEIASSIIKFLNYKDGINVILCSDVPAGSGLGASVSLAVNLVNVIQHLKGVKSESKIIAETAFNIERKILHWPMGKQDEYVAVMGGFNHIKFDCNKVDITPIKMKKSTLKELESNLVLFFVGTTRNSSEILANQLIQVNQRHKQTIDSLDFVKNLAQEMFESLKKSDITLFGELLNKGWQAKKKFSTGVTNKRIDNIYCKALDCGAIGGKLTGAGGGGHMLLYCETRKHKQLIKEMTKIGLTKVNFSFYRNGPKILNLYDLS